MVAHYDMPMDQMFVTPADMGMMDPADEASSRVLRTMSS